MADGVGSISTLGVGSGLQLQDILDQLREVDQDGQITPKEDKITAYQAQLDEFDVVTSKLFALKGYALDLSLATTFLGRSVTSSNEDVLTATVADGAATNSSTFTVADIASKSSWLSSSGVASEDTIVYVPTSQVSTNGLANQTDLIASGAGSLVIDFGGSSTITVDVTAATKLEDGADQANSLVHLINNDAENTGLVTASSFQVDSQWFLRIETATPGGTGESNRVAITTNDTDLTLSAPSKTFAYQVGDNTTIVNVAADTTLSGLVDLINDDSGNPGATASIINDGGADPYRLVLQANSTGEDNRISFLGQLPDMVMAEQEGAGGDSLNAEFILDGISYERQTNTFNDVISGVSITLASAGTASLSVGSNDTAIKDLVTNLVEAYNDLVQELKAETSYDEETQTSGVLRGTTLRDMPFELQNLMTSTVSADASGNITSLFDFGLVFERDGTISIDDATLSSAINSYSSGVESFFLGDSDEGITGFADMVNERLRVLTGADGVIEAEKSGTQERIDSLEQQILEATDRLDKKYELMTKQFIELDRYMNQMTSMSSFLSSQFNSLSEGWGVTTNNK